LSRLERGNHRKTKNAIVVVADKCQRGNQLNKQARCKYLAPALTLISILTGMQQRYSGIVKKSKIVSIRR
jgi:hypothetical protein